MYCKSSAKQSDTNKGLTNNENINKNGQNGKNCEGNILNL